MARPFEKYVITKKIKPEELAFHGEKLKEEYYILLSSKLIAEANYYVSYAEFREIPAQNPTCTFHAHDFDQISVYVGEPRTFAVTYALVPPGKDVIDEYHARKEDEYTLAETGLFFIPAGVKHNIRFDRVDSPVKQIVISMKGSYP